MIAVPTCPVCKGQQKMLGPRFEPKHALADAPFMIRALGDDHRPNVFYQCPSCGSKLVVDPNWQANT